MSPTQPVKVVEAPKFNNHEEEIEPSGDVTKIPQLQRSAPETLPAGQEVRRTDETMSDTQKHSEVLVESQDNYDIFLNDLNGGASTAAST